MHFAAAKIGIGVPAGDFSASVSSVFQSACVLAVNRGALITVVGPAVGGLPAGVTLAEPADVDFVRATFVGASAAARGGILRFPGTGIMIDLRAAQPWRSRLSCLALDPAIAPVQAAWSTAAKSLLADGRAAGLAAIAEVPILELAEATRGFDITAAEAGALRLIGFGAGGTPAGDDFLVGHLAGLWTAQTGDRRRSWFLERIGRRLHALLPRTNRASGVYLEAAIDGEVSERLARLASAIANGAPREAIMDVASAAIAVGHTSGADATLGLLLGIAAWAPDGLASCSRKLVAGLRFAAQP